jgi:hypothetical protein
MRITVAAMCLVTLSGTASAGLFGPDNYYECLLDRLPGTSNDATAQQIIAACQKEYRSTSVSEKKSGFFRPTARECSIKNGKNTASNLAGRAIVMACNQLYEHE